jgi:predicted outer membrane repeat protein
LIARFALLALVALWSLGAVRVADAAVVTLCNTDVEGGAGAANLQTAIAAGGIVTFQCQSPNPTIQLTREHLVSRTTFIDGGNTVTLDGGNRRMFDTGSDVWFRLMNIAIKRGAGVVGGSGRVELFHTQVSNSAQAIWLQSGSVWISDSRFENNGQTSVFAYDSIRISDGSTFSGNRGTPIYAWRGTVVIEDSLFVGNGRSEFIAGDCNVTIRNSQFNSHTNLLDGGALLLDCPATVEMSEFHNNRATNGGAIAIGPKASQVTMRRVKFAGNSADGHGGAVAVRSSQTERPSVTLRHSRFEQNAARWGGAISLRSTILGGPFLQGAGLNFKGNRASASGGAIYLSESGTKIAQGVFTENQADEGGGAIYLRQLLPSRRTVLANSLFVNNTSNQGGSAFHGNSATFINTTIAQNAGVAIWPAGEIPSFLVTVGPPFPTFPIRFKNTIIMGAQLPCGSPINAVPYVNDGNTLQYPGSSCGGTITSTYPGLGPFFAPMPWSPALDGGDKATCGADPVNNRDIYGIKRPLFENCAIGAAEGDIPRLISRYLRLNPERAGAFGG